MDPLLVCANCKRRLAGGWSVSSVSPSLVYYDVDGYVYCEREHPRLLHVPIAPSTEDVLAGLSSISEETR